MNLFSFLNQICYVLQRRKMVRLNQKFKRLCMFLYTDVCDFVHVIFNFNVKSRHLGTIILYKFCCLTALF